MATDNDLTMRQVDQEMASFRTAGGSALMPLLLGFPGREISGAKTDGHCWAGDFDEPDVIAYPDDVSKTEFYQHPLAREMGLSLQQQARLGLVIPKERRSRDTVYDYDTGPEETGELEQSSDRARRSSSMSVSRGSNMMVKVKSLARLRSSSQMERDGLLSMADLLEQFPLPQVLSEDQPNNPCCPGRGRSTSTNKPKGSIPTATDVRAKRTKRVKKTQISNPVNPVAGVGPYSSPDLGNYPFGSAPSSASTSPALTQMPPIIASTSHGTCTAAKETPPVPHAPEGSERGPRWTFKLAPPRLSAMEYTRLYFLEKAWAEREGRACKMAPPVTTALHTEHYEKFIILPKIPPGIPRQLVKEPLKSTSLGYRAPAMTCPVPNSRESSESTDNNAPKLSSNLSVIPKQLSPELGTPISMNNDIRHPDALDRQTETTLPGIVGLGIRQASKDACPLPDSGSCLSPPNTTAAFTCPKDSTGGAIQPSQLTGTQPDGHGGEMGAAKLPIAPSMATLGVNDDATMQSSIGRGRERRPWTAAPTRTPPKVPRFGGHGTPPASDNMIPTAQAQGPVSTPLTCKRQGRKRNEGHEDMAGQQQSHELDEQNDNEWTLPLTPAPSRPLPVLPAFVPMSPLKLSISSLALCETAQEMPFKLQGTSRWSRIIHESLRGRPQGQVQESSHIEECDWTHSQDPFTASSSRTRLSDPFMTQGHLSLPGPDGDAIAAEPVPSSILTTTLRVPSRLDDFVASPLTSGSQSRQTPCSQPPDQLQVLHGDLPASCRLSGSGKTSSPQRQALITDFFPLAVRTGAVASGQFARHVRHGEEVPSSMIIRDLHRQIDQFPALEAMFSMVNVSGAGQANISVTQESRPGTVASMTRASTPTRLDPGSRADTTPTDLSRCPRSNPLVSDDESKGEIPLEPEYGPGPTIRTGPCALSDKPSIGSDMTDQVPGSARLSTPRSKGSPRRLSRIPTRSTPTPASRRAATQHGSPRLMRSCHDGTLTSMPPPSSSHGTEQHPQSRGLLSPDEFIDTGPVRVDFSVASDGATVSRLTAGVATVQSKSHALSDQPIRGPQQGSPVRKVDITYTAVSSRRRMDPVQSDAEWQRQKENNPFRPTRSFSPATTPLPPASPSNPARLGSHGQGQRKRNPGEGMTGMAQSSSVPCHVSEDSLIDVGTFLREEAPRETMQEQPQRSNTTSHRFLGILRKGIRAGDMDPKGPGKQGAVANVAHATAFVYEVFTMLSAVTGESHVNGEIVYHWQDRTK
ncbi:hypothetical protein ACRALDRAFT_1072278 [Sodiomyces alcalophilus JCM 7366]|uniref:uncharacterized protein n=1 Tax=Sodiomyces alcalophilus JCM 7366 TaxID=591952 RepID=UPI0039B36EEF